jgi:hypothetical protein
MQASGSKPEVIDEQQIDEIRRLWDEGIQSGPSRMRVGDLMQELEQAFGAAGEV